METANFGGNTSLAPNAEKPYLAKNLCFAIPINVIIVDSYSNTVNALLDVMDSTSMSWISHSDRIGIALVASGTIVSSIVGNVRILCISRRLILF